MKRKPGEPIYLKRHMLGLALALLASFLLPLLYHYYIHQLRFSTRFIAGLFIAAVGAIALHFTYRASAKNEP